MNHTRPHDIHLLIFYNGITIVKIVIRTFESFRGKMPDYVILRFNFTLSIRAYGSGNTFFCKELAFDPICSTLYCREEYKFLCRLTGKKPVKDTLGKPCVYSKVHICCALITGVVSLTSQVNNSINFGEIKQLSLS